MFTLNLQLRMKKLLQIAFGVLSNMAKNLIQTTNCYPLPLDKQHGIS